MLEMFRFLGWRCNLGRGTILLLLTAISFLAVMTIKTSRTGNINGLKSRLNLVISPHEELTKNNFAERDQEDPALVAYIRDHEMHQPSNLPYNLTNPDKRDFSQYLQSDFAEENFLHGMTGGFFLEAGALDGEDKSNSLYFEKYKGWNGLLVEPDPSLFRHLAALNRKAFAINAGFSLNNKSGAATFVPHRGLGKIQNGATNGVQIRVFPLYSMLLSLGIRQVDFFTLDIEGSERAVLNTIPWNKVKFRLICIEINKYPGGTLGARKFFEARGYTYLGNFHIDAWFGWRELLQETMDVDKWLLKNNLHHHVVPDRG